MKKEKTYDFLAGELLLINKPHEWTSFDVVNKIRALLRNRLGVKKIKVGHAGTLDPLATGLLLICTGKFTKRISELQGKNKKYIATFQLGATTPSYDLETEVDEEFPTDHITEEEIHKTVMGFIGEQEQRPPAHSAKWINGERAYVKARKGEDVTVPKRTIHIFQMEVLSIEMPKIKVLVECSTGTYIRSLAYDFGKALKSGAHLIDLIRVSVGEFTLENAIEIDEFELILEKTELQTTE